MPFRLLSSVADVTAGTAEQISRIVDEVGHAHASVDDLEPRLSQGDDLDRRVRAGRGPHHGPQRRPTPPAWPRSPTTSSAGSTSCSTGCPDALDSDEVTALVYGVPKLARGLGLDDAPTDEVKADQKAFFRLLYNLLVDADRGPRLPTLFLALGSERVRTLLTPA